MANKTATLTFDQTATIGGTSETAPRKTVSVPYQSVVRGDLDVPVGATAGVSTAIPFGTIAVASGARVHNDTSNDIVLKAGGATVCAVPPGGVFFLAGPTAVSATGLTAMTFELTTTQAAVESVGYWIFGDPT